MNTFTQATAWLKERTIADFEALQSLKQNETALKNQLPPSLVRVTEQVEATSELQSCLTHYVTAAKILTEKTKTLDRREAWRLFILSACKTFSKAEAELSNQQMTQLEPDYKELF